MEYIDAVPLARAIELGEDMGKVDSEDAMVLIEACGLPWADEAARKSAFDRYRVDWGQSHSTIIHRSTDK